MRTIELALKDFPKVPASLLSPGGGSLPKIDVPLKELFHHYWLAKYGEDPGDSSFEYLGRITPGPDWRMKGGGIGVDKEAKRNVSNELGKAFARWFMYKFLNHTYFCPFEIAMARSKELPDHKWSRREPGDLPDYVCGTNERDINLLEAKGRYSSLTFKTAEFELFRQQVARARLCDGSGNDLRVKGFIIAARWSTEEAPRVRSKLWVEDPWTDGRQTNEYPDATGRSMIVGHYAAPFRGLQMPVVADTLESGLPLGSQVSARRGIWECLSGPLQGRKFVGGIIPSAGMSRDWWHWRREGGSDPFVLESPLKFFGLELGVFSAVLQAAREATSRAGTQEGVDRIQQVDVPQELGALSLLRDGTLVGPSDYFRPVGVFDIER